jgi:predicted esterase
MLTCTSGGATEGNCETGSVAIASPPRNIRISDSTIASAGRWRMRPNTVVSLLFGVGFEVGDHLSGASVHTRRLAPSRTLRSPSRTRRSAPASPFFHDEDILKFVADDDAALLHLAAIAST